MIAKTLPLLMLCACASTTPLPVADQPEFVVIARPYAEQLKAVGVTRVISPGGGAMVRLETSYGSVYLQYPSMTDPMTFELDIDQAGVRATSATFDRGQEERVLAALVPEAVRVVTANNRLGWLHANPWH